MAYIYNKHIIRVKDTRLNGIVGFSMGVGIPKRKLEKARYATDVVMKQLSVRELQLLNSRILKTLVLDYMALDAEEQAAIRKGSHLLSRALNSSTELDRALEDLLNLFLTMESPRLSEARVNRLKSSVTAWRHFFQHKGVEYYSQLSDALFASYPDYRRNARFSIGWKDKTKGLSAYTINQEIRLLNKAIHYGVRKGWILEKYYLEELKVRVTEENTKTVTPLKYSQVRSMLQYLNGEEIPNWVHDSTLFLLCTGLRVGELERLEKKDFDLVLETFSVNTPGVSGTSQGKTAAAARVIPLSKTLLKLYERGHIFLKKKQPLSKRLGRWYTRHQSEIIEVMDERPTPHQFRHTYASANLMAGNRMERVSRLMGHKGIQITMDQYGKYVLDGVGFEKMAETYTKLLSWMCEDYFH